MPDEAPRSLAGRAAVEHALIRVVHDYGRRPEFVVLGGLVLEMLCAQSPYQHAGTTDVDVQVNLEIACRLVNTLRLGRALLNGEFEPDPLRTWRWVAEGPTRRTVVKFELLADLEDVPAESTASFDCCPLCQGQAQRCCQNKWAQ